MKNYVISLTTADVRRQHITQEFGKQNIAFEFFDAITPKDIDELAAKFNPYLKDSTLLTDGEKACFLSHVCLWQKMIDDDLDYMAVFEDDVYLGENAGVFLADTGWLDGLGIDYLKTETFLQERKLAKDAINLPDNRVAKILREPHLGTAGYIISKQVAKSLLDFIQQLDTHALKPIDHLMFEEYSKTKTAIPIYQMLPAIVAQEFILYPNRDTLPSDLKQSRDQRVKNKPKRPLSAKIKGELSNAYRKTFGKMVRTLVEFR
ncbi:glycosyltransferase family 25 protein [Moraxella marmotae]|uniref:glycosyltransferase family 25 protein n=1 Tax=Moraxella marmotae TaxID=3344520 RepID=UPI0035F2FFDE